jgi:hypothetical protein
MEKVLGSNRGEARRREKKDDSYPRDLLDQKKPSLWNIFGVKFTFMF